MIAEESIKAAELLREVLLELGFNPKMLSQEQIDWVLSIIEVRENTSADD